MRRPLWSYWAFFHRRELSAFFSGPYTKIRIIPCSEPVNPYNQGSGDKLLKTPWCLLLKATPMARDAVEEIDGGETVVESLRILLVEDFAEFRRFVCSLLKAKAEFQVKQASDGLEAVQKAEQIQPQLILLDISLPTLNGIEVARRVPKRAPSARILFLSVESDPDLVNEALSLGAGYIHKPRASRDLLPAIEAVLKGEQFVSDGLVPTSPSEPSSSNLHLALSQAVARAIEIVGADMGSLQILDPYANNLRIAAQVGFSRRFLDFFDIVEHHQCACGMALSLGQRVIVDDLANDPVFRGNAAREIILDEGVRAVQSIPLRTSSGEIVGVLSTHFRIAKPPRQKLFEITDSFLQEVAELIRSTGPAFL